ncbi:hypothetical protein ACIP1U_14350 [Cupriavidus sp. NPDC089707]|uniref:hypothetical protein n=1 Tax=Cupriavidus sp. NPDC089707 TaxID=3363963 RepID=UPI00382687D2
MKGQTIQVYLQRLHLFKAVPLAVISMDESVVTVTQGSGDLWKFTGVQGGKGESPQGAMIEVHYRNASGPLLHRLYVEVYNRITVAVVVHAMTIGQIDDASIAPAGPSLSRSDIETLFNGVNDIWRAAGIQFEVESWLTEQIELRQAGTMDASEFSALTSTNRVPDKLNMYLVRSMTGAGIGWGAPSTALVVGEMMAGATYHQQPPEVVQAIAHEIGHFLSLMHPGTLSSNGDNLPNPAAGQTEDYAMQDYWSRRSLMYVATALWPTGSSLQPTVRQRGRQSDVGYGNIPYPSGGFKRSGGKMLCCKIVGSIKSSGKLSEISAARKIAFQHRSKSNENNNTAWNQNIDSKPGHGVFA